jgi:hypothetical protein
VPAKSRIRELGCAARLEAVGTQIVEIRRSVRRRLGTLVRSLQREEEMRRIRISVGLALILGGIALGLYVGIYYASLGIQGMSDGHLAQGILLTVLWSEMLGIATASALILPGILVLRGLGEKNHYPVR